MNTIKIYLAESGRIADLHKDFPLYQYQYQNKLLNVFVPTSILAPQFTTLSDEGQTLSEYVAGTAVKIGMRYLTRNGEIKVSQSSYLRYLKTLTYQNVEYALFERKLPKEFTLYAGQGQNAPTLVINVVNIETDVEPAETLSIIPSQTCSLDVMPSSNLDNDEAIEPSELETINGRLNAIDETLLEKQDKVDENINLTTNQDDEATWQNSQSVVGALNNNTAQTETNRENIEENTINIAQNKNDIDYLYAHMSQPEEYIGQMTGSSLPTNSALNEFVFETVGREPKNADVVLFILEIEHGADKTYKYIYAGDGWNGYEIPPFEEADNETLGMVKGTYGIGSSNTTLVDISGGEILNIYIKDGSNVYRNIREYLNTTTTNIANIINGTTSVGMALRAVADKLGHDITDTYLTINAGVTKQQLKDYALPREFNDVNFFTADGYSGQLPTGSSPIHTLTTSAVGDFEIFNAVKTLSNVSFQLSNKNSYTDTLFISASANCSVQFRLTTDIYVNDSWETANVELTDEIQMVASQIKKFTFASSMNALSGVFSLTDGNKIRQTLEVVTETSSSITFNVYSNDVYPSTFYLNTTSQTIVLTQGALGELPVYSIVGTGDTSKITFTFPTDSYIADNVEALFDLQYSGAKNGSTQLELSYNSQTIQIIVPLNDGTNNPATVRTMMSKYSQNNNRWVFTGVFKVSSGNISVIADVDNLEFDLIENPNLLINGDFRINQRGQSSYTNSTSNTTYTVDRWRMSLGNSGLNGTVVTPKANGGVNLTCSNAYGGGATPFIQVLENPQNLIGKTLTFSVYISAINSGSCRYRLSNYTTFATGNLAVGLNTITYTVPSGTTQIFCGIICNATTAFNIDIEYMKLEVGSVSTPFSPKLYAEELPKCMRYFQIRSSIYTVETKAEDRPIPMRVDGTIGTTTIGGTTYNSVDAEIY